MDRGEGWGERKKGEEKGGRSNRKGGVGAEETKEKAGTGEGRGTGMRTRSDCFGREDMIAEKDGTILKDNPTPTPVLGGPGGVDVPLGVWAAGRAVGVALRRAGAGVRGFAGRCC